MQISIRWKLIISIVLPLVLLSVIVFWFTIDLIYSFAKERLHEQATDQARHYAVQLDGQFQSFAQVARSTASFLNTQPELAEQQLYELLRANVTQNPLIYGSAIAFEPYQFKKELKLFSPYVYQDNSGIKSIDVATESYDYSNGEWEWFTRPRDLGHAIWTEPFFDTGAGNILMVTHAAPFYDKGKFRGIATIDIPLDKLQQHLGIEQAQEQHFIIVSPTGKFISHPDPELIMKATIQDRAILYEDNDFKQVSDKILNGETGVGVLKKANLMDMNTDGSIWIFYAPIKSTGWSFAMAIPESKMTDYIRTQLSRGIIGIIVMVCLVIVCILLVSTHLTKPIRSLAAAVNQLGQGDLDTNVSDIRSSDEIGQLANGFNHMVEDLRHYVNALTKEVAARELVENELRIARDIQMSLLPRTFPPFPERDEFELHAINEAARHVAGDFFDFFFVNDNTLMLVIADVSGKGTPAALFMAVTRTIIRNLANTGESPAQILDDANKLLIESRTQPIFVTIFLGCYHTDNGKIIYANAGHHPPYRIGDQGTISKFGEATGTIVGMLNEARYENCEGKLDPNESLVLYTDGLPDARSPEGNRYGQENFEILLSTNAVKAPDELCKIAVNEVTAFQAGNLIDDITMLVLRRNK